MSKLDEFKASIQAFLARTGVSRSEMGRRVCGDASFVTDLLADGREPKLSTVEKFEAWMKLYDSDPDAAMGRCRGQIDTSLRIAC